MRNLKKQNHCTLCGSTENNIYIFTMEIVNTDSIFKV